MRRSVATHPMAHMVVGDTNLCVAEHSYDAGASTACSWWPTSGLESTHVVGPSGPRLVDISLARSRSRAHPECRSRHQPPSKCTLCCSFCVRVSRSDNFAPNTPAPPDGGGGVRRWVRERAKPIRAWCSHHIACDRGKGGRGDGPMGEQPKSISARGRCGFHQTASSRTPTGGD